jgi:tRNA threonylcarbamoyladenosine biosynthesis protein TsaE
MTASYSEFLADEPATVACGEQMGKAISALLDESFVVFLDGVLGAGKTTFCRGMLTAFGHKGAVKSPTYTLVEPYQLGDATVYHFDLYRLGDPEELEFMGIRDYFQPGSLCIIEWPVRGEGFLPSADVLVNITPESGGRRLRISAITERGNHCLASLSNNN